MDQPLQWIRTPKSLANNTPYLKARMLRNLNPLVNQYEVNTDRGTLKLTLPADNSYDAGQQHDYEDMCEMDVLNEPEVLANLVRRYNNEHIFTSIGHTLIALNPYQQIDKLFGKAVLDRAREATLAGHTADSPPHVYKTAGRAFEAIRAQKGRQAIVISGESGAGKTESTKYCVQLLTALGPRKLHSIQQKILAANPVLEAFGNSKTVRNENSSRFGKYMNIYFEEGGHIIGASIQNYLLEKSRVVSVSHNERNFHAFYALTASGKWQVRQPEHYHILRQSHCYNSTHVDDAQYYSQINKAMAEIGFAQKDINKIWLILASILELGNIDFDQTPHLMDQSKPCLLMGTKQLPRIAEVLKTDLKQMQKLLLFQKRRFLKQYTLISYRKEGCKANKQALCKALYESLFEFILKGVQLKLQPEGPICKGLQISILDIFGFQNFTENSFEQFCINFANERLLRLYNDYVFQKEMDILKEDGLEQHIGGLVPPSNNALINLISGKLSLFSIINDMTLPQFKDQDIMHGFNKLESQHLAFDKLKPQLFTLSHTPCPVTYSILNFKSKNQDKVNQDILDLIGNLWGDSKEAAGKTILSKFNKQMDDLMAELESSQVHFMRCIKPNELKQPKSPDQNCILTQVRYLGVLQTIFIRKNTFPHRRTYNDFKNLYCIAFKQLYREGNDQQKVQEALKTLQAKKGDYLLGKVRVYMVEQLQDKLNKQLARCRKLREEKATRIQKAAKVWMWRHSILRNLKIFNKRLIILKKLPNKWQLTMLSSGMKILKDYLIYMRQKIAKEQEEARLALLKQAKQIREQERQMHLQQLQNATQEQANSSKIQNSSESVLSFKGSILPPPEKERRPSISKGQGLSLILNQTELASDRPIDPRAPYMKPETPSSELMGKNLTFNHDFFKNIDEEADNDLQNSNVAFEGELQVQKAPVDPKRLQKLKDILSENYKVEISGNEEDFFSPMSSHCSFKMTDLPAPLLNQIMDFPAELYFNNILRKRTTFFGSNKTYQQILVCKKNVLSKSMTVLNNEESQKRALSIFKLLLKIGEEDDIHKVLKFVERFLEECQNSSLELKREIMVQMIRQSNTNYELSAIRVYQTLAVFLHVYNPETEILKATLHLFYWKIKGKKIGPTELEYLTYIFSCLAKKVQKRTVVGYLPINYQVMGLMCKRQISMPIYLSSGTSILVNVESFNSFNDIKEKCLREFGISERLGQELFGFFEVVNFDNEDLEESPIRQTNVVWDMITYWELTKQKYEEGGIEPPNFFLMLKIRYSIATHQEDQQLVQLCFSQLYFEYYMGRILLDSDMIFLLGSLIYQIKYSSKPLSEMTMGLLPINFSKQFKKDEVNIRLQLAVDELKAAKLTLQEMKFKFIKVCSMCELTMSVEIPVDEEYKLFLKAKSIIFVYHINEKGQRIETVTLKRLIRWQINKESLTLEVIGKNSNEENTTYNIRTDNSSIFNELLRSLSTLKFHKNQIEPPNFKKKTSV